MPPQSSAALLHSGDHVWAPIWGGYPPDKEGNSPTVGGGGSHDPVSEPQSSRASAPDGVRLPGGKLPQTTCPSNLPQLYSTPGTTFGHQFGGGTPQIKRGTRTPLGGVAMTLSRNPNPHAPVLRMAFACQGANSLKLHAPPIFPSSTPLRGPRLGTNLGGVPPR